MNLFKRWFCLAIFGIFCNFVVILPSAGFEIFSDPNNEYSVGLDVSAKWTSLAMHAPDDEVLYPERDTLTEFLRLRLGLNFQYNQWLDGQLAYEQRARWFSDESIGSAAGGVLPGFSEPAYRITSLDWEIAENDAIFQYRNEIDRAFVAIHPSWGQITIGRQAIGLGRGVLFSAVDVFSPFSPLETDRQWRRGVDAIRVERNITPTSSAEMIAVFGRSIEQSAFLGRIRGYFGDVDGEFVFGSRAQDIMLAAVLSAGMYDAEVHTEFAFFNTEEEQPDEKFFSNEHQVAKFVLGTSYTFDIGNGLTLLGEYLYNGFGIDDIQDLEARLEDEDFLRRYLAGDMQIIGKEALAFQFGYPFSLNLNGSATTIISMQDGSGMIYPSFNWDYSQNTSILSALFVPWGQEPENGELNSEYGGNELSLLVQCALYF